MVAMSFYKENGTYVYPKDDLDYENDDEFIEVRRSNLQRSRNAHVLIGFGCGIMFTITAQYLFLWVTGVV
jgi:hypothetical protein